MNFGGTILKTVFGTSTIADLQNLHELQSKNADIVHSLLNQVTYVKRLDQVTRVNTDAIANLSSC